MSSTARTSDKIIALLPKDFKAGMESWTGQIEQHDLDTNFGLLIWDLTEKRDCIVLATDLDGDRLTDLLADVGPAAALRPDRDGLRRGQARHERDVDRDGLHDRQWPRT